MADARAELEWMKTLPAWGSGWRRNRRRYLRQQRKERRA